ncbi:MAG TPA: DUF4198 domain-containing protein [Flavipsychrobacter sp.]|nr:DUF4198 domain-containing protein [Flavipsychrobacter sp.]
MKGIKILLVAVLLCLSSLQLSAHGYWLELQGSGKAKKPCTIKMYYGDYPVGERLSGKTLDKMKDIKVYVLTPSGEKQSVTMTQMNDFWQGSFTPQAKGRYEIIGINDEREVQDWTKHHLGITRPVQYLKTTYAVGQAGEQQASLFLDMRVVRMDKTNYEVTLLKQGTALPAQKLVLAEFDKGETEFTTDVNGKINIKLDNPGLYILSVDWIDYTPGSFKGKNYETVRHRLDIAIEK